MKSGSGRRRLLELDSGDGCTAMRMCLVPPCWTRTRTQTAHLTVGTHSWGSLLPVEETRDPGSSPGWGRSPGGGNGNPLQCSCRENSMDRGACEATCSPRGAKSRTRPSAHTDTHMPKGPAALPIPLAMSGERTRGASSLAAHRQSQPKLARNGG